jgi:hypothetical protein
LNSSRPGSCRIAVGLQAGLAILSPLTATTAAAFLPYRPPGRRLRPRNRRQTRQSSLDGCSSSDPKQVNLTDARTQHSLIDHQRAAALGFAGAQITPVCANHRRRCYAQVGARNGGYL